jgi:Insertion element 4 transposase N-terminal/Transposase DDE domain
MARTTAVLPAGQRITDYISLGVIAKYFPRHVIDDVLKQTERESVRERDLPAHVVVYYVIALALYMQSSYREVLRCLLEGLHWLADPSLAPRVAGKSGISQARTRLGAAPLRTLYDTVARPVAGEKTRGAWYRGWRLMSLDGSTLDVADTKENAETYGRPSNHRGACAYPKIRFVTLLECGTHVLCSARMGGYKTAETVLAAEVVPALGGGVLCLADRLFSNYRLWNAARKNGADLLWRVSLSLHLTSTQLLPDGSFLSTLRPSDKDRRAGNEPVVVRVIDYHLNGVENAEPFYRLITTVLDAETAPASELAALYHERWEIETALDELKTHLRGSRIVLRSKLPELVEQEFYGLLLSHYAIRSLMHEAALKADEDPDRISFRHSVRVVQRSISRRGAIPPSA